MKISAIIPYEKPNKDLCFSYNHFYKWINDYYIPISLDISQPFTHLILFDSFWDLNLTNILPQRDKIKIIACFFDPPVFPIVDNLIQQKLIDQVVVFDKRFANRFNVPTYVSDYFFNEHLFPEVNKLPAISESCVFGHLNNGRNNNYNLPKVDADVSSYKELYERVAKYNGVAVYDTGHSEDFKSTTFYNKAKAVETLMCGRNPYCQSGIQTINYDRYLKKYEDIPKKLEINFDQKEIWDINRRVTMNFIKAIL